jgi:hypothetical protein
MQLQHNTWPWNFKSKTNKDTVNRQNPFLCITWFIDKCLIYNTMITVGRVQLRWHGTRRCVRGEMKGQQGEWSGYAACLARPHSIASPARYKCYLLTRTLRLPVVDWIVTPAESHGLVSFAKRWNMVSVHVPSNLNCTLFWTQCCLYNCTSYTGLEGSSLLGGSSSLRGTRPMSMHSQKNSSSILSTVLKHYSRISILILSPHLCPSLLQTLDIKYNNNLNNIFLHTTYWVLLQTAWNMFRGRAIWPNF